MRAQAFEIVKKTMEEEGYSDEAFHEILLENPKFSDRDKRFLKRLAMGTIERCIELDARIDQVASLPVKKMMPSVRTILRMAMYEICYMERIPEAVSCNEAVELAKKSGAAKYGAFINGVLRAAIRKKNDFQMTEDWLIYSMPPELMEHLRAQYGKKTAKKIAGAFLEKSGSVTLHVDENKITTERFMTLLQEKNISCSRGFYMKDAVLAEHVRDVRELPGYSEGRFFVQDESSMLPVLCADIRPGMKVLDVCSAPGGKAMHALVRLKGQGSLLARDVSEKKVGLLRENVSRMKYGNAVCECRDAMLSDEENREKMDVVLADVPCSGIGIIGRKPEIKYRALKEAKNLVARQREICRKSVELLSPGGTFIYSTCTINQAENEENAAWLEEELGLKRSSLNDLLPVSLTNKMTAQGMLQMLPGIHKSDGFFVAKFVKSR